MVKKVKLRDGQVVAVKEVQMDLENVKGHDAQTAISNFDHEVSLARYSIDFYTPFLSFLMIIACYNIPIL